MPPARRVRKNLLFYLITVLVFGTGILLVLDYGAQLSPAGGQDLAWTGGAPAPQATAGSLGQALLERLHSPLGVLLMQLIVIILAARALGSAFLRVGQPAVTGEIVAGILLGPSLLGLVLPPAEAFLFPAPSLGALGVLSQVGVILFMFVVGIEVDLQHLRQKAQAALLVSHASIVVPFFLGAGFALLVYRQYAPASIAFSAFALFMGVAMSITAFPVLARIIEERRLGRTPLGAIAIACAAVDDITAWCMLAVVVAIAKADALAGAALTVALTLAFIVLMLFVIRPRVARLLRAEEFDESHSRRLVAGVLVFVFAAALATEAIGIHALFGAFLAGVVMPSNSRLRGFLRERLETFSAVFLLPLFFALTGLRTQVGLLDSWPDWLTCAALIAVAIAGKLGGSMLAARWTGMGWREAFAVGALMNTRGLVELIVLNIGYDLGILSPRIFTMMVLMALVTTFMTGPILSRLGYGRRLTAR
jgi:Kef-type K+ transport system membrane component KefB